MRIAPFFLFFPALLCAQAPPASLDGDIVNFATGAPIPAARVKLVEGKTEPRFAAADAAGHFHFDNVPLKSYTVSVEHPANLPSGPRPVGSAQSSIRIQLTAGAVLYGQVTDPNGLPGTTSTVGFMAQFFEQRPIDPRSPSPNPLPDGKNQLVNVANSLIDDRGQYHSGLLSPGTYYVAILVDQSPNFWGRSWRFTYYPRSMDLASAKPIQLASGQQVRADIQVIKQAGVKVGGRVSVPSYEPPPGMQVSTYVHLVSSAALLGRPSAHTGVNQDRFEATDLMPGKYTVVALTT